MQGGVAFVAFVRCDLDEVVLHLVLLVVAFADEDLWGQQVGAQHRGEGSHTYMSMGHSHIIRIHIEHRSATHGHNSQAHMQVTATQ